MWLWIFCQNFWNKRDMVNKVGYIGAVGLGLAILGIIARFLWIDCFFFIVNNNNINIEISPLKKGWRSFHRSTKEPSMKICVFTMRNLLDIASESIVLKIFWYWLSSTRAESDRAVTGRRKSYSGRGEDFLTGQPDFFTETAVTLERKVEKLFPMWEINRHAEG